jgi:hypothetical protein
MGFSSGGWSMALPTREPPLHTSVIAGMFPGGRTGLARPRLLLPTFIAGIPDSPGGLDALAAVAGHATEEVACGSRSWDLLVELGAQ